MDSITEENPYMSDFSLKDQYEFKCFECGHRQMMRPSIAMSVFGENCGHGTCLKCKEFLWLKIDTNKNICVSEKFHPELIGK